MACLVGLGSNLGSPAIQLTKACAALANLPDVRILAISRWYGSAPAGGPAGQLPYLNGAVRLQTSRSPEELLHDLQQIEHQLGRVRSIRWGPRTIDLDLLWYEQVDLRTPRLTIPHPRLAVRRFVLFPATEVAPDAVHPTTGWTLARHADHLRYAIPSFALQGLTPSQRALVSQRVAARTGGWPPEIVPSDVTGSVGSASLQCQARDDRVPKVQFQLYALSSEGGPETCLPVTCQPHLIVPVAWHHVDQAVDEIVAALQAMQGIA